MYEHLLDNNNRNDETPLVLDMTTQKFGGGGSDYVPGGIYKVHCNECKWVPYKGDKTGVNGRFDLTVLEPTEQAGAKLIAFVSSPAGAMPDDQRTMREDIYKNIVASAFSGLGKLEDIRQNKQAPFTPKWATGKDLYVLVVDDSYKGKMTSSVKAWVSATEFAEKPGPSKFSRPASDDGMGMGSGASAGSSGSGTPDLMGGSSGGSTASAAPAGGNSGPSAMDTVMGLS